MAKVTVYITNHNYGEFIKQAIASVLDQKYRDWELIIIDDGSTDDSKKVLKGYEGHPGIRIIYQDNKGLAVSNNIALRLARGEYIMRLDADDYLDENALLVLSNILDSHPEIGLVYPDYYHVDRNGEIIDLHRRKKVGKEAKLLDIPAHGACTMIRKSCLLDLGGYREELDCEDGYDLWIRFIGKYKVYNVNIPLFYYRRHKQNMTGDHKKLLLMHRNIKRMEIKARGPNKRMKIICIIPARGGLYDEPGYALKKLRGKKLIDYTVEAAKSSSVFDDIVVVSEDTAVISHAKKRYEGIRTMTRPPSYSRINSSIELTVKMVLDRQKAAGKRYDAFMILYVNCPLRDPSHIRLAADTMLLYDPDCVISVYSDISEHYQHDKNGMRPLFPKRLLRLEREALYVANGAVYMAKTSQIRKKDFLDGSIGHIAMTRNESFRIDDAEDLPIVEKMLDIKGKA